MFKIAITIATAFTLLFANTKEMKMDTTEFKQMLDVCVDFQVDQYRVYPYIRAAQYLQEEGKGKAVALLSQYAATHKYEHQLIVLCRMLFEAKADAEFRRPMLGGASFFGGTDYVDWTKEPIEIVNGVPFLVTRGYVLGGKAESASNYLLYCYKNAEWNTTSYELVTTKHVEESLDVLLASDKWKNKLGKVDVQFFKDQF